MKKLILIGGLIITRLLANGQDRLTLVGGNPFMFVTRFPSSKPTMFILDNGKLDTLSILSVRDSVITTFIKVIPHLNFLAIHQENSFTETPKQYLTIVEMSSGIPVEYSLNNAKFLTRQATVFELQGDSIVFTVNQPPNGHFSYFFDKPRQKVDESKIKRILVDGDNPIAIDGHGGIPLVTISADSLFPDIRTYSDRKIYLGQLPSLAIPRQGTYRYYNTLAISTREAQAIICYNSIPSEMDIGKIGYFIKPMNGNWYYHEFKGGVTTPRSFGNWFVGFVAGYNRGTYYLEKGKPIQYDFKRELPGKGSRRPLFKSPEEEDIYGGESENFEQRAASVGYFYPGILFLFNVVSKEYIEWDTGQADSEILLVHNNQVWFRSDDKIISAKFSKSGLSEVKQIVKDDRVRDIHWAFLKH